MKTPEPSRPSSTKRFFQELKARNVRKTLAIYLSATLTAIGMANLFSTRYQLPPGLFDGILVFLLCGVFNAGAYAWFRGKEGEPRNGKKELAVHGCIVLVAAGLSIIVISLPRSSFLPHNARILAVLPFTNLSDNKEDEYFSDGMTEDILTQLSKIGDLRVISRTSIMPYKNSQKSLREIGRELGAGSILEGSVRRVGARVRIVGQLINSQTDEHLWAETYDREMKDVFAIQSDVAQQIAASLKATLSPAEQVRIDHASTQNMEAYGYYLRGREYYYLYTKEDNERAIQLFQKAIRLDSTYALPYAGLADAYGQRVQRFAFDESWADSAIAVSMKAIRLDPEVAEPYKALGLAYTQRGWNTKAVEQYRRAVAINPNFASAVANLGLTLSLMGRHDEAVGWVKKSITLTPGRASYYHTLGGLYRGLAEDTLSERALRKAIELQPTSTYAYGGLSQLYLMQGNFAIARSLLDTIMERYPDDPFLLTAAGDVELLDGKLQQARKFYEQAIALSSVESGPSTQLGFVLIQIGRKAEGEELLDKHAQANMASLAENSEDSEFPYDLARINAIRSNLPEANRWIRLAIERGWVFYRWCLLDPLLKNLRDDPEFQQTMTDLKAHVEEMRRNVRDQKDEISIPL